MNVQTLIDIIGGEYFEEVSEMLSNTKHPSIYENYGDFQFLILRRLELEDRNLNLIPEAFILKNEQIFYRPAKQSEFSLLSESIEDLHDQIAGFYAKDLKILNGFSLEVEHLEDFLFNREVPSYFMDLWFDLQKDLTRIESFYFRNGIVYREFLKKYSANFGEFLDEFSDIEETIRFHSAHVTAMQSRLESLHNYYESIKNDKLNKTLLFLTIISGIFLPLNLIVGFFGMNTEGMYFTGDREGTQNVVFILYLVLVICLLGLPIIRMVDKWIISRILGRYNFYINLSKKIEKIEQGLKGR